MKSTMMDITDFKMDEFVPYVEREVWSPRFFRWHKYEVRRPRLPGPKDKSVKWVDKHRPSAFQTYVGRDNEAIRKGFNNLLDFFEANHGKLPTFICVYGKPGTGKTSFCLTLLSGLITGLGIDKNLESKWILRANCRNLSPQQMEQLWLKINNFGNGRDDPAVPSSFRIVFLDDFDQIPMPAQMNFKQIMETLAYKLRFIIVTSQVGKLAGYISSRLIPTQTYMTNPIQPVHGLTIMLNILYKNRVGYNREGLHELFRLNKNMDMTTIIDTAQELFLTRHFISKEEVTRIISEKRKIRPEKPWVSPYAAVEPLKRCQICTLFPPCDHHPVEKLIRDADRIKAALPSYRGGMICPEFKRLGYCTMYNRTGHCSLSHPRTIHRTSKPPPRCAQCSLPWPCNHCTYTAERDKLIKHLDEAEVRLGRLRKIMSPNPPGNMIIPLNKKFPDWQEGMKEIHRLCGGDDREDYIKDCRDWVAETFDTNEETYYKKDKLVRFAFGPMLESPMLVDAEEMMIANPEDELAAEADALSQELGVPVTTTEPDENLNDS